MIQNLSEYNSMIVDIHISLFKINFLFLNFPFNYQTLLNSLIFFSYNYVTRFIALIDIKLTVSTVSSIRNDQISHGCSFMLIILIRFVCENTIEEKILKMQEEKNRQADNFLTG